MAGPIELAIHERQKLFRAKIAAAASRLELNAVKPCEDPKLLPPAPKAPESIETWVERQKQYWFKIEHETKDECPTIGLIQRVVAKHYGVTRADILSQSRIPKIVKPRMVAAYLARNMTPMTLPALGKHFGGRDHTTILSSVAKITSLLGTDTKLASEIAELKGCLA